MQDPAQDLQADGGDWVDVGPSEDFSEGAAWPVPMAGTTLAIVRFEGRLYALDDRCSHGAANLSQGWVEDGTIECPLHQGRFELASGRPLCDPVTEPVRCYRIEERDGRARVLCSSNGAPDTAGTGG